MNEYRLYFLDTQGHVFRAVELRRATDEDAIEAAKAHRGDGAMELWQGARRVTEFAATLQPSPTSH